MNGDTDWTGFDGCVDNLEFWNNALSQEEIQQYMSCPPAGNEAGLVGYWNFEEGSGTTAFDQTSNGNDGAINGATYSTDVPDADCNNCSSTDAITVTLLSEGCMDTTACNYDSSAGCDDGSCIYPPVIDLGEDIETCDETVTIDAGSGADNYLWSNGETTQTIEVSESGEYSVELNGSSENNFSMSFDGDDYIDFNSFSYPSGNVAFTLSASVNITSNPNGVEYILSFGGGTNLGDNMSFGVYGNEGLFATFTGSNFDAISNVNVPLNGWHHLAAVYNTNGEIHLYLDGNLVYSQTVSIPNINPQFGKIGNSVFQNSTQFWNGKIDNAQIWSTALTQTEIQQYMSCPPAGNEAGLVGYWNFEEGSGTTAFDQTSNGNDGAINGATYSTDVPDADCNNCSSTDAITVTLLSEGCMDSAACNYDSLAGCDDGSCVYPPVIDLGDDITTCDETVTLDAGADADSYLWSNGETTQTIEVSESGDYSVEVGNGVSADNYSLNFDGVDDYLILPVNQTLFQANNEDFTISSWFKINDDNTSAYYNIFDTNVHTELTMGIANFASAGAQEQGRISLNTGGVIDGGGTVTETVGLSWLPDIWYHIVLVNDSGNPRIYRDGIEIDQISSGSGTIDSSLIGFESMRIAQMDQGSQYTHCRVGHFSIWNTALTQSEIQEYMSCPPTGSDTGLVGDWNFEEGSGTTAFDQTSNGNDGAINGATYNTDVPDTDCQSCSSTDSITVNLLSEGCMDTTACNYDSLAGCDDGSCVYPPVIDLGDDIETCDETVTLDAGAGYDSYLWSNGETTQIIEVTESGNYSVDAEYCNDEEINGFNYGGYFNGSQYYLSIDEISWNEANVICENFGGHLVSISSEQENNFITSFLIENEYWIGIFQNLNSESYSEPNGGFEWVTGEPIVYTNWRPLAPDNYPNGDGNNNLQESGLIYNYTGGDFDFGAWDDAGDISHPPTHYIMELECPFGCLMSDDINITFSIEGCTDEIACNYDSEAGCDDQSCAYPAEDYLDCNGDCLNDDNNNGICDELDIYGCTFEGACNYNPEANVSDNSCYFATALYDCNGECQQDSDGDGICDQNESLECQGSDCCGEGTVWNPATQSCIPFNPCPFDSNDDGYVNTMDLLAFLVAFDSPCE